LADNIDRPISTNKHGKGSTPNWVASAKLILTSYGTALASIHVVEVGLETEV